MWAQRTMTATQINLSFEKCECTLFELFRVSSNAFYLHKVVDLT